MKLFTLNAHSLVDGTRERQVRLLSSFLLSELPDVIALQEANQSMSAPELTDRHPNLMQNSTALKADNFALDILDRLIDNGEKYHLLWLHVKCGYGMFDKGLALLTREKPQDPRCFLISKEREVYDYRRRMALTAYLPDSHVTVCCLHTGRADDLSDPFAEQWKRLTSDVTSRERLIIMGDLNIPPDSSGEYGKILSDGFYDLYSLAESPIGSSTVSGGIDGWSDRNVGEKMRIDYIFSSFLPSKGEKVTYRTVLDGKSGETVSDHFGIIAEIK